MNEIPHAAFIAAEEALPDDCVLSAGALIAVLAAAAPHLHAAWLATVIGYRIDIDGRVYHPADVTIIRKEDAS